MCRDMGRQMNMFAFSTKKKSRSQRRRGDSCVSTQRLTEAKAVLSSFVFFLSYFHHSLRHVAFKWVSEESCSLPWATQLITSTPRTHKERHPQKHNVQVKTQRCRNGTAEDGNSLTGVRSERTWSWNFRFEAWLQKGISLPKNHRAETKDFADPKWRIQLTSTC